MFDKRWDIIPEISENCERKSRNKKGFPQQSRIDH